MINPAFGDGFMFIVGFTIFNIWWFRKIGVSHIIPNSTSLVLNPMVTWDPPHFGSRWRFPEIGVPPHHPNVRLGFSLVNHPFLGFSSGFPMVFHGFPMVWGTPVPPLNGFSGKLNWPGRAVAGAATAGGFGPSERLRQKRWTLADFHGIHRMFLLDSYGIWPMFSLTCHPISFQPQGSLLSIVS